MVAEKKKVRRARPGPFYGRSATLLTYQWADAVFQNLVNKSLTRALWWRSDPEFGAYSQFLTIATRPRQTKVCRPSPPPQRQNPPYLLLLTLSLEELN